MKFRIVLTRELKILGKFERFGQTAEPIRACYVIRPTSATPQSHYRIAEILSIPSHKVSQTHLRGVMEKCQGFVENRERLS